jgi:beta-N-acetylhexosaminidase
MKYPVLWLSAIFLICVSAVDNTQFRFNHNIDQKEVVWVDSLYQSMSVEERIGQLIMIRAHSDKDALYEQQVEDLIRNYKVGGLCFFQGTPEKQALLTNRYQSASPRIPLFISMDAEWGIGMRLKESVISFPKQLMLGAIQDNKLIYDFGQEVARQCRRLGVHINFAPDADINNNASNPVINDRSFGENKYNVSAKCFQYMMGMQDGGVMACAKHFPGHGDTDVDSHFDLPQIKHSIERLDSLELFPFRVLSQYGVGSVMVAHLNVPALDPRSNRPTTLSKNTITQLLREKIGFEGLIFTDAMEMQGVAKYFQPGEADLEALIAGNDMVLLPGNVEATIKAVKDALNKGLYDTTQMKNSVKRVLRAKYRYGLNKPQKVIIENIRADLNSPTAALLKRRLIAAALTLVRDRPGIVGFESLEKYRLASLAMGDTSRTPFQTYCGYYAPFTHWNIGKEPDSLQQSALIDSLRRYDVVFISLHNMRSKASDQHGLSNQQLALIQRLNEVTTVCLTIFGNPYSLKHFDSIPIILQAYNEDPITQSLAAQGLFGAVSLSGKLPVTVSASSKYGQGLTKIYPSPRLGYDVPESVGLNSDSLRLMEPLIQEMIAAGATPGCQVLVARHNKVVWHKAYGYQTYDSSALVTLENLYDLASVTKIGATTLSAMKLSESGQLSLDSFMSRYVPELKNSNKKDLTVREILCHHAGLQPWIPFYKQTLEKGLPDAHIYHREKDRDSEIPVASGMYMDNRYVDTLWSQIYRSELRSNKNYKYSDLGLYLSARAIENISGTRLDAYALEQFYRPLGLSTMTFNPWARGWSARCVPTEEDRYFRQQRLQGYVHDMGAAMLGGVSGHAGLFSNANDLAKLFQMLLNGGQYGGRQYLQPTTIHEWTTRYPLSTRRGIGFDMKELDPKETQNMNELASANTFGHTGFTGICVWADPDKDLIFIFLSNRTYPSMDNNKLINGNYRPRLQGMVYRAIQE